mmetsp:Transcript_2671/g.5102  ORF Transcript_2671/g.5102 Transcript_2671/m.5102 type:complete len:357 (+) Transcript_2671:53-1123(+)
MRNVLPKAGSPPPKKLSLVLPFVVKNELGHRATATLPTKRMASNKVEETLANVFRIKKRLMRIYRELYQKEVIANNHHHHHSDSSAILQEECHELFDELMDIRLSLECVLKTKVGISVSNFAYRLDKEQYPRLVKRAAALYLKMKSDRGNPTGMPLEALNHYRHVVYELTQKQECKPDMIAYKELRHKYSCTERKHGLLEDIPVGLVVEGRGEAAILGIHTQILSGIDSEIGKPCFAVCISGKYDDADGENEDGTIIYTGSGGLKNNKQVKNQTLSAPNIALIKSYETGVPVRVLRRYGDGIEYRYEGVYKCIGFEKTPSSDGPLVYSFKLHPMPHGASFYSIMQDLIDDRVKSYK